MSIGRGTWNIEKKIVGVWTADGTIYRPNANLVLTKATRQVTVTLADGENAYYTPEEKFVNNPVMFAWQWDEEGVMKAKIEGYVDNHDAVKITDHNGYEYIGRFTAVEANWIVGEDIDYYDVKATLERMPSLA